MITFNFHCWLSAHDSVGGRARSYILNICVVFPFGHWKQLDKSANGLEMRVTYARAARTPEKNSDQIEICIARERERREQIICDAKI